MPAIFAVLIAFIVLFLNENLETLCICSCLWAYKITHPAPARIKNGPRNIAVRQHTTLPPSYPLNPNSWNPQKNQLLCPRHCVHLTVNISNLSVDWKFSRRDETEIEFSIKSRALASLPSKYLTPPAPCQAPVCINWGRRETERRESPGWSDIQIQSWPGINCIDDNGTWH